MEIILKEKKAYKWFLDKDVYFTGYFFYKDSLYNELNACKKILGINSYEEFKIFVKGLNGCFSIIKKKDDEIWAAVDRGRSMSLFYSKDLRILSDSSSIIKNFLNLDESDADIVRLVEFVASGYVSGNNTVFQSIKQLNAAQTCLIKDSTIQLDDYYYHFSKPSESNKEILFDKFYEIAKQAIERILKVAKNRPIVLSLSGGYDSRFIACMLKECGVDNVSCYTYGKEGSFEVEMSKKVADSLGYRWKNIEYDEKMAEIILNANDYWDYSESYDYSIFLQNFYAVYCLEQEKWFLPNSVFVTGLCGDMPTGYYIPNENEFNFPLSKEQIVDYLINKRFQRFKLDSKVKEKFKKEVLDQINKLQLKSEAFQDFVSILDAIETIGDHSRRFLKMNNVHEFFGYEWLLPFWDNDLLDFLYGIPAHLRFKQNFYEEWLMIRLFNKYSLDIKKKVIRYSNNKLINKITYTLGGIMTYFFYNLKIPIKRKFDINNFAQTELLLFKKIKEKKSLNYRRLGLSMLLIYYCCEKYYGVNSIKNTHKYLRNN